MVGVVTIAKAPVVGEGFEFFGWFDEFGVKVVESIDIVDF